MYIYLPIAEYSANLYYLSFLGLIAGIFAGIFGIGGGIIVIPGLMFCGIPSAIALSTSINQSLAASFSSMLAHFKKKNVSLVVGNYLVIGSLLGIACGSATFKALLVSGNLELVIACIYILMLGVMSFVSLKDMVRVFYYKLKKTEDIKNKNPSINKFFDSLPGKIYCKDLNREISCIVIAVLGLIIGFVVSLAGVGGGLILVPMLIYLLGMPALLAIGTSVYQAVFVTAISTVSHSLTAHTVDLQLAFILMVTAAIGAQIGVRVVTKIPSEWVKILLCCIIVSMLIKFILNLTVQPHQIYSYNIVHSMAD